MARDGDGDGTRPGSILFHNEDRGVILVDVPRSIEEAQVLFPKAQSRGDGLKRLVSSRPLDTPFQTPEPKDGLVDPTASVSDLMSAAAATNALGLLRKSHPGPWCLPRLVNAEGQAGAHGSRKRKRGAPSQDRDGAPDEDGIPAIEEDKAQVLIPEDSFYLHGTILSERARFLADAPEFDLIVLDPPWPNRSARRRKGNYRVADSLQDLRQTLSLIPIAAHLAPEGLVAVWVTNKPSVVQLLTGPTGMFAEWGLEQVDEWTWLKVTTAGEPIIDINSAWRRPWERILIARRRGSGRKLPCRGRVIISVPDLHSRKPNLRGVFEDILTQGYRGLEVFARNLTAGWWSWGDQALKFQGPEHWVES